MLYLSGGGVGGPTLMTDQTLGGTDGLARRGWFCHARVNRLCVFKADYLHGVVPGAFWGDGCVWYGVWCLSIDPQHNQTVADSLYTTHLHTGRGLPPTSNTNEDKDEDKRRITFMASLDSFFQIFTTDTASLKSPQTPSIQVGFWRTRVKPKPKGEDGRPGASMDLAPLLAEGGSAPPAWVAQGREQLEGLGEGELVGEGVKAGVGGVEGPLPCVWERLGGQTGVEGEGEEGPPPLYDHCFQGF